MSCTYILFSEYKCTTEFFALSVEMTENLLLIINVLRKIRLIF
ncbi:hypothetical protein CCAND95_240069 [Capnocytophaga canis]|uniref:Uncharacterized protein n=1 Tax=Capnocytophaga canis TaxID=1848903 RepID=A0A0B7I3V1_9FLAO|nr:hypothetical protein CCAND95_240069 [Capnocytophaga canis]CEN44513.1 hypothetical protein CCAND38_180075 [Capnocytophaga canis]CEN54190.1 hypothetical protein CCAND93_740012 [Capnocytophaga canis]